MADAVAAGVERMVSVGTDVARSCDAIAAARRHPGRVWATVGLHPHEARQGVDGLEALLVEPEVVAVGECGLDYYYEHSPREAQRAAFAAQIALAKAHDLALVIHTRRLARDVRRAGRRGRARAHGAALLHRRGRRGPALPRPGRPPVVLGHRDVQGGGRRQAAALCPLDRMLVETDSPYLAPVPTSRPNRPALVPLVGAAVAVAGGHEVEAVAAATWANAAAVYRLDA